MLRLLPNDIVIVISLEIHRYFSTALTKELFDLLHWDDRDSCYSVNKKQNSEAFAYQIREYYNGEWKFIYYRDSPDPNINIYTIIANGKIVEFHGMKLLITIPRNY